MTPRPKRRPSTSGLRERIVAAAWEQIAAEGAPALSLRAIARALGITAPAIYNYFPDRDALVTALIVDAYADFGGAQLAAAAAVPGQDPAGRLRATGRAYRAWALQYPERYHLIFGTPIPGYAAPVEKVMPVAARSLAALMGALEALRAQKRLRALKNLEKDPAGRAMFEQWKNAVGAQADIQSAPIAVLIWARVHGLVSLEISGGLPPFGSTPEALYEYEMDAIHNEFVK
jgi:AcrR family transcriptional regulator